MCASHNSNFKIIKVFNYLTTCYIYKILKALFRHFWNYNFKDKRGLFKTSFMIVLRYQWLQDEPLPERRYVCRQDQLIPMYLCRWMGGWRLHNQWVITNSSYTVTHIIKREEDLKIHLTFPKFAHFIAKNYTFKLSTNKQHSNV